MEAGPPVSDPSPQEEAATERPAVDVDGDEGSNVGRRAVRRSVVAVVAALVIAAGVASFLLLSSGSDSKTGSAAPPARGLACPYLQQAADAYERGDRPAFDQAIDQAAQVAKEALQRSGEAFGDPERIALELRLSGGHDATRLLEKGHAFCSKLAQSNRN